jgi:ABC-type branched-subunit amino acid transport system substrate-binding protein
MLRMKGTLLALLAAALCLGTARAEDADGREIVLGMSTALTGPAADLGKNMRIGVLAGLRRANADPGRAHPELRLIDLDDGYEPARTAPNMRRLIEKEKVLAVIGNVGTPTAIVAVPIANECKTPFFAPFTGAGVLRKQPPDRYVFNYRASYAEETAAMIDALVGLSKLAPADIAFLTQRDGYGDSGYAGAVAALRKHGLTDDKSVVHVRYERNTVAVEGALATILSARRLPRAVILVGAYAPCAKFIGLCSEAEYFPLFLNVSFVGSASLARGLEGVRADVIVTQVVPHPEDESLAVVREFREDLAALDPDACPSFGALEGYIATRIFARALARAGKRPDREAVVAALEALGTFDLGLGHALRLDGDEHQASHMVWPTVLEDGRFVPFSWNRIGEFASIRSGG